MTAIAGIAAVGRIVVKACADHLSKCGAKAVAATKERTVGVLRNRDPAVGVSATDNVAMLDERSA